MLRGVLICPDQELGSALERALLESRCVAVLAALHRYPDAAELERLVSERRAEVVFVSFESPHQFSRVAAVLESKLAGLPIVAVCRQCDHAVLLDLMRAGAREVLSPPFEQTLLREALSRVARLLDRPSRTFDRLYAFLPAKAGVGASTVALNASVALSRIPETTVLLMDFDLNSGMIGFMLKLNSRYSVVDAVEHAHELDQDMWARLVWPLGNLDVLPTGTLNPGLRIDPANLHPLLAFARRCYKAICVDLSGMMEKYSIELLRESARIFLVCTPEIPSLHLGAEKLKYLRGLDLAGRVEILLNRAQARSVISRAEIERILGAAVRMEIPNDYAAVHAAIMAGQPLPENSRPGRRFRELAHSLMEVSAVGLTKKRRFFEYFFPAAERTATLGTNKLAG